MYSVLNDPDLFYAGDPWSIWREMRSHEGLVWSAEQDGPGFWSVTRYADAVAVLESPEAFGSSQGTTLEGNRWLPDPAADRMLPLMDPPLHGVMRGYLAEEFTASRVARHAATLRREVDSIAERAGATGTIDIDKELGRWVPVHVTLGMFGASPDEARRLAGVIDDTLSPDEDIRAFADAELLLLVQDLIHGQQGKAGDNLVRRLCIAAQVDDRIREDALLLTILNLLQAGLTTTRLAINGMFAAFAERPGHWRSLRAGDVSVKSAVEEVLRWTSPALAVVRTARVPSIVAGTSIDAGSRLAVWLPSANRDEAFFRDPDQFSPGRASNRHLGFGQGIHRCIGMALARLELAIVLEAAARHWSELGLLQAPQRLRSLVLHGVDRIQLAIRS